ncbi:U1 small nuclear ribonucleoprotein 70 kDa [Polyodon spathula]|uniref:U1 small nuclear ribonucleoprotein 70 kDa n=1 Tax=Polyodon spathula TaxID=7913 RepID=UPI001B7DEE94|nr:U1 small nuclear ribonucleoprotein 70 kDa [Polyodon spathula]
MTQFLPPNLLALFAPRDPVPYLPPLEKLPHEKHHNQPYSGIGSFIRHFEDPRDAPPPTRAETRDERLERKRREKIEKRQSDVETELKLWDPHNDPNAQGDAFKTLFVARVNYDTTESKLRREFEVYGPIKRIYIVFNKSSGKPRGYAFIASNQAAGSVAEPQWRQFPNPVQLGSVRLGSAQLQQNEFQLKNLDALAAIPAPISP